VPQYPHEEEILFGPLTGIEVLSTRIDDSVVIIECAFNVNLTTLTLEKVLNKRHRLLEDMSQNIVLEVPSTLAGTGLEQEAESRQGKLTEEMRSSILDQRPEQYNDDSRFREAVEKILKVKSSQIGTVKILEDMRNLKPPELKKHATFVVAQLSESSADVHDAKAIRDAAVETLGKLDKPDLALWAPMCCARRAEMSRSRGAAQVRRCDIHAYGRARVFRSGAFALCQGLVEAARSGAP
jgi:hypothetical protein